MAKHKKRKLQNENRRTSKPSTSKSTQSNLSAKKTKLEPTIPFQSEDRILLVGEGDFSFAKSIVKHHGCCDVTATCLDTQVELFAKYDPQGEEHVKYLQEEGQTVLYGIDATKLDKFKAITKGAQFDVVMFNFPHVGGKSTDVNRQVRFNQELLVKFFGGAKGLLSPAGTIVVTIFEGEPYTLWNVRDLGRHCGLQVQRSFGFMATAYPGYSHARTLGNIEGGGGWKGEDREARTFVFENQSVDDVQMRRKLLAAGEKRKRRPDEGSSDDEG